MADNTIPQATTPAYNPTNPEYYDPKVVDTKSNVTIPDSSGFIDPKTGTVEGRVTNLMSAPNELLKMAKAESGAAYNQKGLLMSAGAVQAGTGAMMGKAIEIATPDALAYSNMAQTGYKAKTDSLLNNQLADIEKMKSINDARFAGALTKQEQAGKYQLQKMIDTAQMQRIEVDNQWKDAMNIDALKADEKKTLAATSATMGTELMGSIERILRDTNITNKTQAIDVLMSRYRSNMTTTAALYGITLSWS